MLIYESNWTFVMCVLITRVYVMFSSLWKLHFLNVCVDVETFNNLVTDACVIVSFCER